MLVGLTCCNALSEKFEIIMTRYGERYKIGFTEGVLTEPLGKTKIKDASKHGTTFVLVPSKRFLGSPCEIESNKLEEWMDKIIYLVPDNITINLSIKKRGKESLINRKFKNKYGLYDYVKRLCPNGLIEPVHILATRKVKQEVFNNTYDRFMGLEVAFTYNPNSVEMQTDSFCNFVNTIDDGTHVDGVRQAILQYFSRATKESLSDRESKKLDITYSDVSQGLVLTVYLSTDYPPQFTGQTKEKVGSPDIFRPVREMTYNALSDYFEKNPKITKKVIDRIKVNARARIESTKVRNSVIRGKKNDLQDHMRENFSPANNTGKDYKELIIIEGKSARGTASEGRFDRDTQAVYSLRGVPLNSFNVKLDVVRKNTELDALIDILGCGIGPSFNIKRLNYDKIIIMADSDSDGFNITSIMCAFFMFHMPDVVKDGYVFKAVSPLYELKNKKRYVLNKQGYAEVFEREIHNNIIVYDDNKNKITDKMLQRLLIDGKDYGEELDRASKRLSVDPHIIEYYIIHRNDKNFMKSFKKEFPELSIENGVLSGIYQGRYQIMFLDKSFEKRTEYLNEFVNGNYKGKMYYYVSERNGKQYIDMGRMSVGQFIRMVDKFQPVIMTRFKGIGELDPSELRETTMDPNNRILIRLTSEDMEKELETFDILHGNNSDGRKLMMKHFKINREDLDN